MALEKRQALMGKLPAYIHRARSRPPPPRPCPPRRLSSPSPLPRSPRSWSACPPCSLARP
eukprot:4813373-Pyramimonas_sp.AAC.1